MLQKILDNKKKKLEADLKEAKKKKEEKLAAKNNIKKETFESNGIRFTKVN